jgi:hypothetical protein
VFFHAAFAELGDGPRPLVSEGAGDVGGELVAACRQMQQIFLDLREFEALGQPAQKVRLVSQCFDALHGTQSIAIPARAKAPRKGSSCGAKKGTRHAASMERLISLDHPKALDRVGERVAFCRQLIDLTGIVTRPWGDVVEGVRDRAQLVNSIHACTNADGVFWMHAPRQKSATESSFLD